ncbi:MAG: hypothetical protein ACFFD4_26075 [Candidatus Odinarchaeota archaeon]
MPVTIFNYLALLVISIYIASAILLLVTLVKRYSQTRVIATLFLIIVMILMLVGGIIEISVSLINFDNLAANFQFLSVPNVVFNILGIITAGIFLLFIDYFENESISTARLAIFAGVTMGHIGNSLTLIGINLETVVLDPVYGTVTDLAILIFPIFVPFFLVYVVVSSFLSIKAIKRFALDELQLKQLTNMQLAIILFYGVTTLSLSVASQFGRGGVLPDDLILVLMVIIPRSSVAIGCFVLLRAYAMTTRTAFLQPQRMHKLIVISKAGLPLYSFSFRQTGEETDTLLLSGGISAIKSLLKEAIGTTSEIKAMKFKEIEIMVSSFEQYGVFLIVDRPSNFLLEAIENFGMSFHQKYKEILEDLSILEESQFKEADDLIKKAFGLE